MIEIDHNLLPKIKCTKVSLIPLQLEHITEKYLNWLNSPEINKFLESRNEQHTLDSTNRFLSDQINSRKVIFYGIWTEDGIHIGNVKVGPINCMHLNADIGFLIGEKEYWGKGIATDVILHISKFASSIGIKKLYAGAYIENRGSINALIKAGFTQEGELAKHVVLMGRRTNVVIMGLLL
jgi:ribosomal-protein-alanine N-acetyltransferase